MPLELDQAFIDSRTRYFVNEKRLSKSVLFGADPKDIAEEIKGGSREVSAEEWDAFKTKSMLAAEKRKPSQ